MYRYYLTFVENGLIQTEEGTILDITDFAEDIEDTEIISLDVRKILDDDKY